MMQKENILLFGSAGTGKSSSIATLFKLCPKYPELRVCFLALETNALGGLKSGLKRYNINLKPGQLFYMEYESNPIMSMKTLVIVEELKAKYADLADKELSKVKVESGDRSKRIQFIDILKASGAFKGIDYVTKETSNLGDYLTWDSNTIFVVDSLTAWIDYLSDLVQGPRVESEFREFKAEQSILMNKVIVPLTQRTRCSVIFLGHSVLSNDPDAAQPTNLKNIEERVQKVYPKFSGNKLNDIIPSKFTETIYAYVDKSDRFFWAGKRQGVFTSVRKIPRKGIVVPDFSEYGLFSEE